MVLFLIFYVDTLPPDFKIWVLGIFIIVETVQLCNDFIRLLKNKVLNYYERAINNAQDKVITNVKVVSKCHSPVGELVVDGGVMYFPEKFEMTFSDGSCLEFGELEYHSAEIGNPYAIEKIQVTGFRYSLLKIYKTNLQKADNRISLVPCCACGVCFECVGVPPGY